MSPIALKQLSTKWFIVLINLNIERVVHCPNLSYVYYYVRPLFFTTLHAFQECMVKRLASTTILLNSLISILSEVLLAQKYSKTL